MLPEFRWIESELLPMLRERAPMQREKGHRQAAFWRGSSTRPPLLLSVSGVPERERLPDYDLSEIHFDSEKMFVNGLKGALSTALADGDALPSMRANMGCGVFATMFGLNQLTFPDKMPWLQERRTKESLLEMTADDLAESKEYRAGLEHMCFMKQMLRGTGIEVYPMDLQGPVDTAHLVLGDRFFYELYDDPEFVKHLLSLCTDCCIRGLRDCLKIIDPDDYVAHYNGLALPSEMPAKISEDTSTLLCPEHIEEFVLPYTNRLLGAAGGGYIHYCGRNDRLFRACLNDMPGSLALNFGNPDKHDMPEVLAELKSAGKKYYGGCKAELLPAWLRASGGRAAFSLSCPVTEQNAVLSRFADMANELEK